MEQREEILRKYCEQINHLKEYARLQNGISENEFDKIYFQSFSSAKLFGNIRRICIFLSCFVFIVYILFYKHETNSIILRNIQVLIYPGMKIWRKLTLPIIAKYPSLTEYYDESCLLTNPLFQVTVTCECIDVLNIDVLERKEFSKQDNSKPLMFFTSQTSGGITLDKFKELYHKNEKSFKQDAYKIISTNREIRNLDELFQNFRERNRTDKQPESHNLLRCNRLNPARLLRQLFLFPKPKSLPETGVSIERFLAIDTPRAQPYKLPDTECPNIFLIQGYGSRIIILRPTTECRTICRTLSVKLSPGQTLIYNWWYWKPISMPDKSSYSNSLTYIGSYC